ncbi:RhoGAP-domain-containing protein [Parathielavia hyrcaniae]|uniref:RhoGAP-domain-containing protein n=1 Tax=Parathielavia hyrcaniae TaxID=113614 RepID=A0AAN6QGE6_9PEZI|nr:RhoGAP-domain-containing protein [Parathielavia hyrcaniae]
MTSSGPPPPYSQQPATQQHQHQQRANVPPTPSTPVASQIQAAVSPPSKRDLKSWWKGFKLPSKHHETHGTEAPFFTRFPRSKLQRKATLFAEDMDGNLSQTPPAVARLGNLVSDQAKSAAHRASASMSQPPPATYHGPPKLSALNCTGAWPFGRRPREPRHTPPPARTKLTVAEHRPQGIFGVPLRQSITYANVAISLVDEDGKSYIYGYVPIVVAKCGVFLKERATEVEGIFRLSGSEKRIKELKNIFDSPDRYGKGLVWNGYTVHDAANVLRRYLNDLPEPVVPLDLYEKFREPLRGATKLGAGEEGPQFVDNFDMDAAIVRYQQLITELPPLNRQLLLYILDLLAVFAAKSDQNRMTSQNLAAIFQPGMLSHPNHAMAPEEYRLNQCVIIFLIENQDHFLIGMQGTAADEKTVREVQKGTPALNPPSTPTAKVGIVRSASTASAGAESVAKDGSIRRNKSTASRCSLHSNGAPSPASPVLTTTPSGGLARSNTVPSKKSPALQSGRFASRGDAHVAPLTPVAPPTTAAAVSPPPDVEEFATPPEESAASIGTSTAPSRSELRLTVPGAPSQEKLLESPTPETTTPSKERRLPILFQRLASGENDGRQPNKLRKKRLPGSANPSAHSSTASLPQSSPNAEALNPLEAIPSVSQMPAAARSAEAHSAATPRTPQVSPSIPGPSNTDPDKSGPSNVNPTSDLANSTTSHTPTDTSPSRHIHSDALHPGHSHAETLHPSTAGTPLKSKKSPPTSLHSSFNEGSDLDQVDEQAAAAAAPAEVAVPDTPSEKDKKRRWRLSRKRDDAPPLPSSLTSPPQRPVTTTLGSNATAGASGTSINSSLGKLGPTSTAGGGTSVTDASDRTTITTMEGAAAPLVQVSSMESGGGGRDRDREEPQKKISTWIKNKYREHKENVEQRRNKSPPPPGAAGSERTVSLGSSLMSGRGKSLDLKRGGGGEEERPAVPVAPVPVPVPVPVTVPGAGAGVGAGVPQAQTQVQSQSHDPQVQ